MFVPEDPGARHGLFTESRWNPMRFIYEVDYFLSSEFRIVCRLGNAILFVIRIYDEIVSDMLKTLQPCFCHPIREHVCPCLAFPCTDGSTRVSSVL